MNGFLLNDVFIFIFDISLRKSISEFINMNKNKLFYITEYNKPFLVNENLFFNLSYSGKYGVLAISKRNIGVDIEKIRKFEYKKICNSLFSKKEIGYCSNIYKFYTLWTLKEAYIKFIGHGINEIRKIIFEVNDNKLYNSKKNSEFFSLKFQDYIISIFKEKE